MKTLNQTFATLTMTAFLAGGSTAFAAQDPVPAPAPAAQEAYELEADVVTGELVEVDPETMTLTIKGADDKSWTFRYTSETEVSGGQSGVAGLATKAGTLVTVHFKADQADDEADDARIRVAKKIEMDE